SRPRRCSFRRDRRRRCTGAAASWWPSRNLAHRRPIAQEPRASEHRLTAHGQPRSVLACAVGRLLSAARDSFPPIRFALFRRTFFRPATQRTSGRYGRRIMPRRITPTSSLETLKREAKDWLAALRANDGAARARLNRALDGPPAQPTLRHVQLALAREL